MSNTKKAASGKFDMSQKVKTYAADEARALNGTKFDKLKVVDDIAPDWEGADESKRYCGLVPVTNDEADYRAAWRHFELRQDRIASFPKGASESVEWVRLTDDLHTQALTTMKDSNGKPETYENWLKKIAAKFENGGWFTVVEYTAKNKKGGIWQNAILGASLTQPKSE